MSLWGRCEAVQSFCFRSFSCDDGGRFLPCHPHLWGFPASAGQIFSYFLAVPALEKLRELNGGGDVRMEIVTKAKNPARHLKNLFSANPGGDALQRRGAVHLKELFFSIKSSSGKQKLNFIEKRVRPLLLH